MKIKCPICLIFAVLILFCLAVPLCEAAENSWTAKTPIPTLKSSVGVGVANDKIYMVGGYDGETTMNWEYNVDTDSWTQRTSLPVKNTRFAVAGYQNRIYVFGGVVTLGEKISTTWVYDPAADSWEIKASMPVACSDFSAYMVDDRIYLLGGSLNLEGDYSSFNQVYDPQNDSWVFRAELPKSTSHTRGGVIDNKIHVFDWFDHMIYDVDLDAWSLGASPPLGIVPTAYAGATVGEMAPRRLYVIGAAQNSTVNQVYDPLSGGWSFGASMPSSRYYPEIAVVNDRLYVLGGVREVLEIPQHYYPYNEEYTPFDYGDPDSTEPLPTTSPTSSPTITPSSTPTSTQSETPIQTSISPSPSSTPSNPTAPSETPNPSPSIPEFPIIVFVPIVFVVSGLVTLFIRRNEKKKIISQESLTNTVILLVKVS